MRKSVTCVEHKESMYAGCPSFRGTVSKQYTPETQLQYVNRKFLPTRFRVKNPGKCWLKFDALQIVIKEMDKRVYQNFFLVLTFSEIK